MHICAGGGPWIGRTSTGGSRGAPCAQGRRSEALAAYARAIRAGDLASVGSSDDSSNSARTGHWRMRHASDRWYEAAAAQWLAPLISE
jgi:hypothetical protein